MSGPSILECGCEEGHCTCKVSREEAMKSAKHLFAAAKAWGKYATEDGTKPLKTADEVLKNIKW